MKETNANRDVDFFLVFNGRRSQILFTAKISIGIFNTGELTRITRKTHQGLNPQLPNLSQCELQWIISWQKMDVQKKFFV